MTQDFGMRVRLRTTAESIFGEKWFDLRNVTEVHYNYPPEEGGILSLGPQLAVESDIHHSGWTCRTSAVAEMEVKPETELAENF